VTARDEGKQAGGSSAEEPQSGSSKSIPPSFGATPSAAAGLDPAAVAATDSRSATAPGTTVAEPAATASGQETEAEPTVGWYASAPAPYHLATNNFGPSSYGTPSPYASAGPLAAGGAGRRGVTGGLGGHSGRSRLLNITLFGIAPLALAGIVAIAFVLSSSGKGQAATHTAFKAGAAPSAAQQAPQGIASTTAPAPSASHRNTHKGKTTAGSNPSTQPVIGIPATGGKSGSKSKPKSHPKPKPAGPVTPHNLGAPNFDGYCQHIGWGSAVTTANNAYGWHCSANPSLVFSMQGACAWTYGQSLSKVINVSTDYYSTTSWQCWQTNGVIGQLNIATYCTQAGLGAAKLNARNAYGWTCGNAGIDTNAACQLVFHNGNAFSRFAVFADPYSWQCWD
jgi:hypothetical protein